MRPVMNISNMPGVSTAMPKHALRKIRTSAAQVRAATPSSSIRKSKSTPTLPTSSQSNSILPSSSQIDPDSLPISHDSEPEEIINLQSHSNTTSNLLFKSNQKLLSHDCHQQIYTASCMRKNSPQGLNVGELTISDTNILFHAKFLNPTPCDEHISLPLIDIVYARRTRARMRLTLPHAFVVRTRGYVDYVFALSNRSELADVIAHLDYALSQIRQKKRRRRRRRGKSPNRRRKNMNRKNLTNNELSSDDELDLSSAETTFTPSRLSRSSNDGYTNKMVRVASDGDIHSNPSRNIHLKSITQQNISINGKKSQFDKSKNVRFVEPNDDNHSRGILKQPQTNQMFNVDTINSSQHEHISSCIARDRWFESWFLLLCSVLLLLTGCCLFASVSAMRDRAIYLKGFLAATAV